MKIGSKVSEVLYIRENNVAELNRKINEALKAGFDLGGEIVQENNEFVITMRKCIPA